MDQAAPTIETSVETLSVSGDCRHLRSCEDQYLGSMRSVSAMKLRTMRLKLLGAVLASLWSSLSTAAAATGNFELLDASTPATAFVKSIELQLGTAPTQRASDGVRVTLSLRNVSARAVTVGDASDLCRLEVLNKDGWPVSPPPPPPRLLINSKAPHEDFVLQPQEERELRFSLPQAVANSQAVYAPSDGKRAVPIVGTFPAGVYRLRMYCTLLAQPVGDSNFSAAALRSDFLQTTLGK